MIWCISQGVNTTRPDKMELEGQPFHGKFKGETYGTQAITLQLVSRAPRQLTGAPTATALGDFSYFQP